MCRRTRSRGASRAGRGWVVAALAVWVLVGCGGQGNGTSSSSDRPLPDPGPTTPSISGPTATTIPAPPDTNLYKVQVSVEGTETPGVVTSDVGGISCPSNCFARYPLLAPVTLTAQAEADGHVFAGWGGACSSVQGSTCRLSVDEGMEVTARYATGP
jgi:hypothetical protein